MMTFLMLGKYSAAGVQGAKPARTKKAAALIEKCGGQVKSCHALLGRYDLAALVDFPGVKEAMKASFHLSKATGIAFSSLPAVSVEEFDQLISG